MAPELQNSIFLDTNIYLHFTFFDEIDWVSLLGVPEITLVVPPIVLKELDGHKYGHPSRTIKGRADKVVKKFNQLLDSGVTVRPGVQISFDHIEPREEYDLHHLDRRSQDDQLIASILRRSRERPSEHISLVTGDVGLKLRGRQRGIPVFTLPDEYRRPEEADPREKQIRELERRLREFEQRSPALELRFDDGAGKLYFQAATSRSSDDGYVSREMKSLKRNYPKWELPSLPGTGGTELDEILEEHDPDGVWVKVNVGGDEFSAVTVSRYNSTLDKYYAKYEKYLRRKTEFDDLCSRSLRIILKVTNESGTAPAEDVVVHVKFPDDLNVTIDDERFVQPEEPNKPEEPQPQRGWSAASRLASLGASMVLTPALPYTPHFMVPESMKAVWRDPTGGGGAFSFGVRKLNHGYAEECPGQWNVVFNSVADMRSFKIEYTVTAANVPRRIEGALHVVRGRGPAESGDPPPAA